MSEDTENEPDFADATRGLRIVHEYVIAMRQIILGIESLCLTFDEETICRAREDDSAAFAVLTKLIKQTSVEFGLMPQAFLDLEHAMRRLSARIDKVERTRNGY